MQRSTIHKSSNDLKEYKLLTLDSGLEVLLVSSKALAKARGTDANNAKAAAALCVQTGSFCDPLEAQGCAHFLEHMVFMGSQKYPKENQYDNYISSHGGYANAMTEGEYTVYLFDITAEYLPKAIDMFAQCFISPLLSMDASDREINAIESEFKLASTNDSTRIDQLLCQFALPGHVLRKFGWGNINSLSTIPKANGVEIQPILKAFHSTHYHPSAMKLVVLAPRSIEELEAIVIDAFGAWGAPVDSNEALRRKIEQELLADEGGESTKKKGGRTGKKQKKEPPSPAPALGHVLLPTLDQCLADFRGKKPFLPEACATLTRIIPVMRSHKLHLSWQLPSQQQDYRHKVCLYIGHLIGHEGEGSLLRHLKTIGYAMGLSAGVTEDNSSCNSMFAIFRIAITLTAEGLSNWIIVVRHVALYLQMLRTQGPQMWVFEELQKISRIDFDYLDEEEEEEFVERLSIEMSSLYGRSREDLLASPFLWWEWDPSRVEGLLDHMCMRNACVAVSSCAFVDSTSPEESVLDPEDVPTEEGDWEDVDDEEGSEDGEDLDGAEAKESEEEAVILTAEQILALYTGPASLVALITPPTTSPEREEHFGTKFWRDTIPEELLLLWEPDAEAVPPELHLPPKNAFIPDALEIISGDVLTSTSHLEIASPGVDGRTRGYTPAPVKIVEADGLIVWHTLDTRFRVPKVEFVVQCISYVVCSTALNAALNDLTCKLLRDALNETLYMAAMAELHAGVTSSDTGLVFRSQGFSDKSLYLAEILLRTFFDPDAAFITADSVTRQLESLVREYTNDCMKSSQACYAARLLALKPSRHSSREKLAAITALGKSAGVTSGADCSMDVDTSISSSSIAELQRAVRSQLIAFHANLNIEMLSHGNLSAESVSQFATLLKGLCPEHPKAKAYPQQPIIKLPLDKTIILTQVPRNPNEPSICCELYYQFGLYNDEHVALMDLLEAVLEEPYFDSLRTKQQLGYSVSCGCRNTFGVLGFCFQVVSSSYSLAEVQAKMLSFVDGVPNIIRLMSKTDFKDHIDAIIIEKLQIETVLGDAAAKNWDEISDRRYDFNSCQKHAAILRGATKESLCAFASSFLLEGNRRMMSIQVSVDGTAASVSSSKGKSTKDSKSEKGAELTLSSIREVHEYCELFESQV